MGYDLHITKAESWVDASDHPIPRDAWERVVEFDPELVASPDHYYELRDESGNLSRVYGTLWTSHSDDAVFWFQGGEVTAKNPDDLTILKMLGLADRLDARVLGDDGESYQRKAASPGWEAIFE